MKRQILRLTENDLHNIIRESVLNILKENDMEERHVLKIHNDNPPIDDMPPMDEPPMPPMGDNDAEMGLPEPNNPPMGNSPMDGEEEPTMGENEPPMDDKPMNDDSDMQEIDDVFSKLDLQDKNSVLKYAKSMADDDNDSENMKEPQDNMPMENKKYNNKLNRIIEDVLGKMEVRGRDRKTKRNNKDIANPSLKSKNPFVVNR